MTEKTKNRQKKIKHSHNQFWFKTKVGKKSKKSKISDVGDYANHTKTKKLNPRERKFIKG